MEKGCQVAVAMYVSWPCPGVSLNASLQKIPEHSDSILWRFITFLYVEVLGVSVSVHRPVHVVHLSVKTAPVLGPFVMSSRSTSKLLLVFLCASVVALAAGQSSGGANPF